MEPEFILQYSQASGYLDLLADQQPRVRIAEDDLVVYIKQLNLRTRVAAGQAAYNELPGVDIAASMLSTPTYLFRTASIYDHHDVAAGARWGFSTPEAYREGMRQANFQYSRDAVLFGLNPQNGEGLANAPNATAINLPPDSYGNTTSQAYDNGQMSFFLANQVILPMKTRTVQLGIGRRFAIVGPQRTLGTFEYNIVQLVQAQRDGAGTMSTRETLESIIMKNGDTLSWGYDDTLIGAGYNGADLVIVTMPEVQTPRGRKLSTNSFAEGMSPANQTCVTQYCDMAAPREIVSPGAYGATNVVTEWRLTSGWAPRSEAVSLVSMPY